MDKNFIKLFYLANYLMFYMKNHKIQPFTVKLVSSVYEKRILHPEWSVSVYIKKGTGYTIRELDRRKTYE